jgi:hypothetical protein
MNRILDINNIDQDYSNLKEILFLERENYSKKININLNMLEFINGCKHDINLHLEDLTIEENERKEYNDLIPELNKLRLRIWSKDKYVLHYKKTKSFKLTTFINSRLDHFKIFIEDIEFQEDVYHKILDNVDFITSEQVYYLFKESINETKKKVYGYEEYVTKLNDIEKRVIKHFYNHSKGIHIDLDFDLPEGYSEIFVEEGAAIFYQFHKIYFTGFKNFLANYSFIFYALKEYGYIKSKSKSKSKSIGTEYKNYISKIDIPIPKIDSRQNKLNDGDKRYEDFKNILKKFNIILKKKHVIKI